jgi:hypothetical protein
VTGPGGTGPAGPGPGGTGLAAWLQRRWWLVAAVAALVALVVGGSVQHAVDQRTAARDLYRVQVLTAASRVLDEEQSQIALPVTARSAARFGALADAINGDLGVNGSGGLTVTVGTGSAAELTQIAFTVTVAAPYGTTTFVAWVVRGAGPAGLGESNVGACVLSSSLLGPGRATGSLNLGTSGLAPCSRGLWSGSTGPMQPHLARAGIPEPGA